MRTDPTDNGGLFIGRRPGTAPIRYRALPQRGTTARRRVDRTMAVLLGALMVFVNLLFWGPLPAGWLWVGSQVNYQTGSVTAGIFVAFLGLLLMLMGALALLKRLDHAWILVRRAAGFDQRKGIIGPIFAITAALGGAGFTFWLIFVGGLGPTLAPQAP